LITLIFDRDLLSEFDYWQFWRNTADSDVIRFLKLFTEVPLSELAVIEKWQGSELNAAKILLADEATRLLHGNDCLAQIHATVDSLFASGGGGGGAELESLPKFTVSSDSVSVVDLLVLAGMSTSKGEAKRLIKGGGARINDEKVTSEGAMVGLTDFGTDKRLKLSSGKKSHCLIVLN
jgi:tyrosyl-tRNA synthetase